MIWGSLPIMTFIDLAIIAFVVWALCMLRKNRTRAAVQGMGRSSRRVILGLVLIGAFYTADLMLMWVLPRLEAAAAAHARMTWLHLNLAWVVMLAAVGLVATGFVSNLQRWVDAAAASRESAEQSRTMLRRQNQALSELKASETRLQTILDTAVEAIIRIDQSGTIQDVNAAAVKVFGYAEKELVGSNVKTLMPSPDREQHDGYLDNYRRTGVSRVIGRGRDVRARKKDGSEFPVHLDVTEYRLDERQYFTGFITDLSDRVRVERQLRQAQKRESLGRLAAGVSHEFNNMLTVILAYSEKLEKQFRERGKPSMEVTQIREAAEKSIAFVGQLLNYSRTSSAHTQATDLNRLIREADTMLRPILDANVQLETIRAGGLGTVMADPEQIKQALVNLVMNARDAMPDGGTVTIETANVHLDEDYAGVHVDATPGQYVLLAVSDTGTGMDDATREQVFEPFFTTKAQGSGTGLGLSTVQGIVRQNGGSIGVYSEPGCGSTFKIYLPRSQGKPLPNGDRQAAGAEQLHGDERILVVDDEVMIRDVTGDMLGNAGYQCCFAGDGLEALEILAQRHGDIDLLLTDLVMPRMGGVELAKKVAQQYPTLPVVCLTGYTENGLIGHAIEANCKGSLQKPFTVRELLRLVRGVLDESGAKGAK